MNVSSYDIVYILGNAFSAFTIYKFMHIFYSQSKINGRLEKAAYLIYFVLITATHIFIKIPVAMMIANILLMFLLALLYEGTVKKAVLTMAIIYFSLLCVETFFAYLTGVLQTDFLKPFHYDSEIGLIAIRIVSFALVFAVQGFKNIKEEYPLPNIYWLSLLAVPASTLVMLYSVSTNADLSRLVMLVCIASALTINMLTFYLYDKISVLLVSQMNRRIAEEQNRYYEYQVQMMKTTLENMRVLRHDLKNKLSPLHSLATAGKSEELASRIAELTELCSTGKIYCSSGNSTVDSIINFKLQQAENENITVVTDILIPSELAVPTFDIAVILGNLIDNALEAVAQVDDRLIEIKIKYTKGCLIAEIGNTFDGFVNKIGDQYLSRKNETESHGMGIRSVEAVLQKYDGAMQISHDERIFRAKLLMYL